MDRPTFDRDVFRTEGPYRIRDRFTGEDVPLSDRDFDEMCRLHLCDWLEQVARSQDWDCRRAAYRRMAERLGGVAFESYDRVFAEHSA